MDPHDEGFKSNEALETTLLCGIKVAILEKMRERWWQEEEKEREKKTNDALPGSRRIHYDGLPLFRS